MKLSLDQLEVLESIDRLGSFSAAARHLGRATSAVSYAIKSLETALSIELFDRSGHKAELTRAGRLVLGEAREVMTRARGIESLANRLQGGWEARLAVVFDGVISLEPAMRVLKRFNARELPTTVELRLDYLGGVQKRFETTGADLMLTVDAISEPSFVVRPLSPVEMVLATHREHPLARAKGPLGRHDFHKAVELLIAPAQARELPHIRKMFMDGPHVFELSDFYCKRQALLSCVGFGWVPTHLVQDVLATGQLVILPFEEGSRHQLVPQLVHRRGVALGRAAEFFVELLEEEFARDMSLGDQARTEKKRGTKKSKS